MHKKLIYLASPFFTPDQLATVKQMEKVIRSINGLAVYSPREDGILMNMTPKKREASALKIFKTNITRIMTANAMLCILDEKDTGTTFENGYAYYHRRYQLGGSNYRLMAFTTTAKPMNIMLQFSFDGHAQGWEELQLMLENYAEGRPLTTKTNDVY